MLLGDAIADRADADAVPAARTIVAAQEANAAVRSDVTVDDPSVTRHEMPPGVTMAVTPTSVSVDADRPAIALMPMGRGAPEFGNIGAADIGMTTVDRYDQVLAGWLTAGGGERRRARRRDEGEAGGQTRCGSDA